jgi:hypothetical protein
MYFINIYTFKSDDESQYTITTDLERIDGVDSTHSIMRSSISLQKSNSENEDIRSEELNTRSEQELYRIL